MAVKKSDNEYLREISEQLGTLLGRIPEGNAGEDTIRESVNSLITKLTDTNTKVGDLTVKLSDKTKKDDERVKNADLNSIRDRLDALITHLAPSNEPVGDAVALWGYFLRSSPNDPDSSRLYLNINFDEYLEFGVQYVKHVELLASLDNPLGGHMVWVTRNAEVLHVQARSVLLESGFLQGQVSNQFLQGRSNNQYPPRAGAQGPVLPYFQTGPLMNNYQMPGSGGGCTTSSECACGCRI